MQVHHYETMQHDEGSSRSPMALQGQAIILCQPKSNGSLIPWTSNNYIILDMLKKVMLQEVSK